MSVEEYNQRFEAYNLSKEDEYKEKHWFIWLSERVVTATDKKGKFVMEKFEDFYQDPEKAKERQQTFNKLHQIHANLKQHRERGGN